MDPGSSHLEQLKRVPNLVQEDPSIITPSQQKKYMNMSWKDLSAIIEKDKQNAEQVERVHDKKKRNQEHNSTTTCPQQDITIPDEKSEPNWDSETGYQDSSHAPS